MGTYGDYVICPDKNCGKSATMMYNNSCMDKMVLICPHCGLELFCKEKKWIVEASSINFANIGKEVDSEEINKRLDEIYNNPSSVKDEFLMTVVDIEFIR